MRLKITFLFISVFLLHSCTNVATAQIRKGGGGRKGSIYFSGGLNTEWYNPSTIHVNQAMLANSYDLTKVTADNKTTNTSINPAQFNYRIGYYFGYHQKYGIELNYDPINYHVTDGQSVVEKGTVNNIINVNKSVTFSAKNGYYYTLNGINLGLVNAVRRFTLFRPNSNRVAIDALVKAGVGPAMPNIESSLPGNKFTAPNYQYGGWNTGVDGALRFTFYRYVYLEFAAKYDYASLTGLNIYEGTAQQNIGTFELIGSLGFTFPTTRFNPLFYKGRRIITILPLYMLKDHPGKSYGESKEDKLKRKKGGDDENTDVPEFNDIKGKNAKPLLQDSLSQALKPDSLKTAAPTDSTPKKETKRERKRRLKRKREAAADSAAMQQGKADSVNNQAPKADNGMIAQPKTDTIVVTQPPVKQIENVATPAPAKDTTGNQVNEPAENKGQEPAKDTSAMSNKQRRKMERRAEKQAQKAKKEKDAADLKAKREQEKKEREEKLEKEKEEKAKADSVGGN